MYRAVRGQAATDVAPGIGHLVRSVVDLDSARQAGVAITLDDIGPVELQGIRILQEERAKHQEEQHKRASLDARMKPSEID